MLENSLGFMSSFFFPPKKWLFLRIQVYFLKIFVYCFNFSVENIFHLIIRYIFLKKKFALVF